MTSTTRYDGGFIRTPTPLTLGDLMRHNPPLTLGDLMRHNPPVTPALILAARRGFVQALVIGGSGTFQDDDVQRAEDFFDDMADKGCWSDAFYQRYAKMDPWEDDK